MAKLNDSSNSVPSKKKKDAGKRKSKRKAKRKSKRKAKRKQKRKEKAKPKRKTSKASKHKAKASKAARVHVRHAGTAYSSSYSTGGLTAWEEVESYTEEGDIHTHLVDHTDVPKLFSTSTSNERHAFVACRGCFLLPITGPRFKCTTCADVNFCENCMKRIARSSLNPHAAMSSRPAHAINHTFRRVRPIASLSRECTESSMSTDFTFFSSLFSSESDSKAIVSKSASKKTSSKRGKKKRTRVHRGTSSKKKKKTTSRAHNPLDWSSLDSGDGTEERAPRYYDAYTMLRIRERRKLLETAGHSAGTPNGLPVSTPAEARSRRHSLGTNADLGLWWMSRPINWQVEVDRHGGEEWGSRSVSGSEWDSVRPGGSHQPGRDPFQANSQWDTLPVTEKVTGRRTRPRRRHRARVYRGSSRFRGSASHAG